MEKQNHITRRRFIQTAGKAATVLASAAGASLILPASVRGATAPSNRITVACIGTGNQGFNILQQFLKNDDAQIVAVCDVNRASYGYKDDSQFLGREPAQKAVNAHYAEKTTSGRYKGCDIYTDFREVLARKDIDAVTIVVPDQWHALMTVAACKAGKDIYCEKPLSLTIRQGQEMTKAVRQYKRILQTGSHERSNPTTRRACELVRNGRIGQLKKISNYSALGSSRGW